MKMLTPAPKLYSGARVEMSPNRMANIRNEFYVKRVADIRVPSPRPLMTPWPGSGLSWPFLF